MKGGYRMMDKISILDCTLRDGGYVNNFNFGQEVIRTIIDKLSSASIDIIECGFLVSDEFDKDRSLFGSIEAIKEVIGLKKKQSIYVAMIQYGKIGAEEISVCNGESIDGIRVTFHEHEIEDAFSLGKSLMDKGYKVFMQPVGTMTYTDEALLNLIKKINQLQPFAFYMVDTLGIMYANDLRRMFYLIDNNLNPSITLGFHSHNNLQLSFANAQELIQKNSRRKLIIDTSIYGMGRGAGNLNTELMTQYLNFSYGLKYDNFEILELIDEYIKPLMVRYKWGYDIAYYIAAIAKCHPNYATYLINKNTLNTQGIYAILRNMSNDKRALFDGEYATKIYAEYMGHYVDDQDIQEWIKGVLNSKNIMLIAPGKSTLLEEDKINQLIDEKKFYVISVNFIPKNIKVDMAFVSNMKRFHGSRELQLKYKDIPILLTSNISTKEEENIFILNYSNYLNEESCIVDNAGLMCINFLKKIGVQKLTLVGFDGFSKNAADNYYDSELQFEVNADEAQKMNIAIEKKMRQLRQQINIEYYTDSKYE